MDMEVWRVEYAYMSSMLAAISNQLLTTFLPDPLFRRCILPLQLSLPRGSHLGSDVRLVSGELVGGNLQIVPYVALAWLWKPVQCNNWATIRHLNVLELTTCSCSRFLQQRVVVTRGMLPASHFRLVDGDVCVVERKVFILGLQTLVALSLARQQHRS